MKALVMLNANARQTVDQMDIVDDLLAEAGIDGTIVASRGKDQAVDTLRNNAADVDAIIVGGGDGTLNALLPEILRADKPLGVLPLGTANDFAQSIDLTSDLAAAVETIATGRTRSVDVAFANGKPFLNAINVGLGERVAAEHGGVFKTVFGVLAYPLKWWDAWRANDPFAARIVIDHEHPIRFKAEQVSVANSQSFGGRFQLDETNTIDSGKLSVAGMRPKGFLSWLRLLLKLTKGNVNDAADAGVMPAKSVRIETQPKRAFSADGDRAGQTPVDISVEKQVLTVFATDR